MPRKTKLKREGKQGKNKKKMEEKGVVENYTTRMYISGIIYGSPIEFTFWGGNGPFWGGDRLFWGGGGPFW